jgi:hypothetical protein
MYVNETYRNVRIDKHLPDILQIQSDLKNGDYLSPLFFNFAIEFAIGKIKNVGLKLNATYQPLLYADDIVTCNGCP